MGRGFTLVELLIVVIIIAVLAAIALPKFANSSERAEECAIRQDLRVLREAADRFYADTNAYPANVTDLSATTSPTRGLNPQGSSKAIGPQKYKGPYLHQVPLSPRTGAAYIIVVPTVQGKVIHHPSGRAADGSDYYSW